MAIGLAVSCFTAGFGAGFWILKVYYDRRLKRIIDNYERMEERVKRLERVSQGRLPEILSFLSFAVVVITIVIKFGIPLFFAMFSRILKWYRSRKEPRPAGQPSSDFLQVQDH